MNSFTVSDILPRPLLYLRRKVITSSNIRLPSVLPVPDTIEAARFLCLFLSLCVCVCGGGGLGGLGGLVGGRVRGGEVGAGGACVRACVRVCVRAWWW